MAERRIGFTVFGGNMPFLGGRRIPSLHGERYADWLTQRFGGTGDTDYVGYFFHRAAECLGDEGTLGFIATATITDGDNRRTVLVRLLQGDRALQVYGARTGFPWPGNAQVRVSIVHLARGFRGEAIQPKTLNGDVVEAVNSRLRSGAEWPEPVALKENDGHALVGCFLRGDGFILEADAGSAFLKEHPEESDVVRPFVVGDDLTNTPTQEAQRFVVDFRDMTLEEARRYPHALAIVENEVRPGRERLKLTGADADHRRYWWRFANTRRELRERARTMPRFLATARVSKRSVFTFVPSSWTPSEQVVVFPLPSLTAFAVLQSRVHRAWVMLHATHMGEAIRYSVSECFSSFPFPTRDPATIVPELEAIGQRLLAARAEFMRRKNVGLTQTYNALGDPDCDDAAVRELRRLHETVDRSVLHAYGFSEIDVPPFCAPQESIRLQQSAFDDSVAGRLFALNAARAAVQLDRTGGAAAAVSKGPGPRKASEDGSATAASRRRNRRTVSGR